MFEVQKVKNEINIKGFNSIYYFEFGKNFSHTPEKHDFWEMVYVDSGEIIAITDGIGCSLKQGQVIFHEPGEIHSHISNKKVPNNMLVICFSTDSEKMNFFSKKTFALDKQSKALLSLFINEATSALGSIPNNYADKGNLNFENSLIGATQMLQCYLTEFLIKLIRSGENSSEKISSSAEGRMIAENSITELMKNYMRENVCENLTLKDICSHFMLGKSQFSKIFKENSGESPVAFYMSLKIAEAKKLLREGNMSVGEIAEKLGYSDIYVFSRAFKRIVGLSPSSYKKSVL